MIKSLFFGLSVLFFGFAGTTFANNDIDKVLQLIDEELALEEPTSIYIEEEAPAHLDENVAAINRIYELGITKFGTVETYMGLNTIRRDEAAAMFLRFAEHFDMLGTSLVATCSFPDLGAAHRDLTDEIVDACKAGLFQGAQGYFLPTASITNAQAITVMARILEGKKSESGRHRADNYYAVLKEHDLLKNLTMDTKYIGYDLPITRLDIAILLYRTDNYLRSCEAKDEQECLAEPLCTPVYGPSFCNQSFCTDDEVFGACLTA